MSGKLLGLLMWPQGLLGIKRCCPFLSLGNSPIYRLPAPIAGRTKIALHLFCSSLAAAAVRSCLNGRQMARRTTLPIPRLDCRGSKSIGLTAVATLEFLGGGKLAVEVPDWCRVITSNLVHTQPTSPPRHAALCHPPGLTLGSGHCPSLPNRVGLSGPA